MDSTPPIDLEVSLAQWEEYDRLKARRRVETLTPEEQERLILLSDQIEEANARRIAGVVELARARGQPLEVVMDELGIEPRPDASDY